jgi:hypothetical protein
MKVFEVMGKIDEKGQLLLDEPLEINSLSSVKVIVLILDESENDYDNEYEYEYDPDDTPMEEIKASLKRALLEYKEGKTHPISELWKRIDV